MTIEAAIDYVLRKPIPKRDFMEIFNKILMQIHLSSNHVSVSMNEIGLQFVPESMGVVKPSYVKRATSAFIKDVG